MLTVYPEKLNFKQYQTCDRDVGTLEFINEIELAIRSIKPDSANCSDKIKFTMTIGKNSYVNKNKSCRQDVAIKIYNYFGCAIPDLNTIQSGY